jgi:hypothetical protein
MDKSKKTLLQILHTIVKTLQTSTKYSTQHVFTLLIYVLPLGLGTHSPFLIISQAAGYKWEQFTVTSQYQRLIKNATDLLLQAEWCITQ